MKMKRLTYELGHKGSCEYDTDNTKNMPLNNIWLAINKLGQLEDIEEELGCDLITLFKALKNGIYFRNPTNNKINSSLLMYGELEISVKGLTMISMEIDILFYFKDYGKTWALTKEELKEN